MSKPKKSATKKPVTRARSRVPGSMADQINTLEPGNSVAVAERIPLDHTQARGLVVDSLTRMRSAQAAYVSRITEDLDLREFKVESGTFLTDDKSAVIATVVVTRLD
jgi:hypothetical protein